MPMTNKPDESDPAQMFVHRAMEALKNEFKGDAQLPRFIVVVEMPPDGRIGIASTGDDEVDTHRILTLGAAAVSNAMTPEEKTQARKFWSMTRAGF